MKLFNTLTRQLEEFKPLNPPKVTYYSCGPTVYDFTHIGHMRYFFTVDIIKRALNYLDYQVKHVMNITDVGHLSGDDDSGEDKMEKGASKYGKTVWEVAQFYTDFFMKTLKSLNVQMPDTFCKATDHIDEMIRLIKKLEEKGFVYQTDEAVYFDTSKFADYGKLSGQKLEEKLKGARQDVYLDPKKKNSTDFALWFKQVGRFKDHSMHWPSPWGEGFPGWHIECSAMSTKYLGESIDIHTGGIDHIAVHHEDEIAQSEGVTNKQFVKYWIHVDFLNVDGKKMSKSLGNFYTIDDLKKNEIDPLSLRLLFLQTHYRQSMNFTWESAKSNNNAYLKLKQIVIDLQDQQQNLVLPKNNSKEMADFKLNFQNALANDFQTPQAVAVMWEMLKSDISVADKLKLLFEFDQVLGLKLSQVTNQPIPEEVNHLAKERQVFKAQKNFIDADKLREKINQLGYLIKDVPNGFIIKKK